MAYGTTYSPERIIDRPRYLKMKLGMDLNKPLYENYPKEVRNVNENAPNRLAWQYHFEKLQKIRESRAIPNTDRFLGRDQSVIAEEIQRRREKLMPRLAQLGYGTNLSTIDQIEQAERNVRRADLMKNLEESRKARLASKFVSPERLEEQEARKARAAIAHARIRREGEERRRAALRPRSSSAENRIKQTNIRKGVESALIGTKFNRAFRQLFGFGLGLGLVRSAARFVVGGSLTSAAKAQQTSLASLMTGASFSQLYGAGGLARVFGGSEKDAASMYASINAFRSGALMGHGLGQLGSLMKYRVNINPFMSSNMILDTIARRYHEIGAQFGPDMQAQFASETGLSAPIVKAMSEHWENFSEWMESEMPKLSTSQEEMLNRQARAANELGVAFDNLKDALAVKLIPILEYWTDVFNDWTGSARYSNTIEWMKNEHPEWGVLEKAKHLKKVGLGKFIPETIFTTEKVGNSPLDHGFGIPTFQHTETLRSMEKPNPLFEEYKKLQEAPASTIVPSVENKTSGVFEINLNAIREMNGLAVALGNAARSYLGEDGIDINIRTVA